MALTPVDVHNIVFSKATFGRRGYDEEEVDAFLNEIETTLAGLHEEIARRGSGTAQPTGDAAVLTQLDQIQQRLTRIEAALGTMRR
jgi:DivIVA domain-containing protein